MPTYPDDISYEKFFVILEPFINDKSKINVTTKAPISVKNTLSLMPTEEAVEYFVSIGSVTSYYSLI